MKIEDISLIEKFLEGTVTQNETKTLLQRLEEKQIPIDEIQEMMKMNGLLYAEFHKDKNTEKISAIVNRGISQKKSRLSDRVIRRIERKKEKKIFWPIAALLFLSLFAVYLFQSQQSKVQIIQDNFESWTLTSTENSIKTLVSSKFITNDSPFLQTYELPDGSIIELYPDSKLIREKNQLILEKGKLQANIKKQKIPLNFKSGNSNCLILGTKFILQTYQQQEKSTSELIVVEGIVEMKAFSKKELVKSNQKCLASSYNQTLFLSTLQNNELVEAQNPNIIYSTTFEKEHLSSFWKTWKKGVEKSSKNSKGLSLAVSNENKKTFIESKLFKTHFNSSFSSIKYHIGFIPKLSHGVMKLSLIFSNNGIPYYHQNAIITKEKKGYKIELIIIDYGVIQKGKGKQGFTRVINRPFTFQGNIFNNINPAAKGINLPGKVKAPLENISLKVLVEQINGGDGQINFSSVKFKRIFKESKK